MSSLVRLQRAMFRAVRSRPRDRFFAVNLSSHACWYIGPARALIMLISASLCVALAWECWQLADIREDINTMTAAVERVQAQDRGLLTGLKQRGIDLSDSAIQLLPKEVGFANQLIAKKAFSWSRFLSELEQSIPPRIAISSIRIDSANSVVHLTGSAANLEDVASLTVRFQDHPYFKEPVLGQHRDVNDGLVEFDLSLQYKSQPS